MRYLLYNPLSGTGDQARSNAEAYAIAVNVPVKSVPVTEIKDLQGFFDTLEPCDDVVFFGGDGTLNQVANALNGSAIRNDIYYYPCGTGNDFARDIGTDHGREPIMINDYVKSLPTVTVNGKQYKFINGVGFGIDGYCCEVGDELKRQNKKPNYTAIAIKGLLFHYKPTVATVTVDGVSHTYKKVWIAATMKGRYYGGGMMNAPAQDRLADDGEVTLVLFHGKGRLKTLMAFPSIFEGKHVEHKDMVAVHTGKEISVSFDHPAALQIDGETRLNVTEYTVTTGVPAVVTV